MSNNRELCVELSGDEKLLFADGFDECILGVGFISGCGGNQVVVYDQDKIIKQLAAGCGDVEDARTAALEHFDYNVSGGYVGAKSPMFVTLLNAP
jgi:hypothetical protein